MQKLMSNQRKSARLPVKDRAMMFKSRKTQERIILFIKDESPLGLSGKVLGLASIQIGDELNLKNSEFTYRVTRIKKSRITMTEIGLEALGLS